jgi:hypothetical protein
MRASSIGAITSPSQAEACVIKASKASHLAT